MHIFEIAHRSIPLEIHSDTLGKGHNVDHPNSLHTEAAHLNDMSRRIILPISQEEQARQSAESLLPRKIYESIVAHLVKNLQRLQEKRERHSPELPDLDDVRSHEAILISGSRGSGKSSVLVNIGTYLKNEAERSPNSPAANLWSKLLILRPVDPTLLDTQHDLFLNVIVAAIIRNAEVQERLSKGDESAQKFYGRLNSLGAALEAIQTTNEKYGLERLRSFMGNHGLAGEIHQFFRNVLDLTGRELIVLPIDDVDTSLHHAFENLEIVRRYLASPFVAPIISGDVRLYHQVIWREMLGRMLKDSAAEKAQATTYAKTLAVEYQIKVLPLSRRLSMPDLEEYLRDSEITLTSNERGKNLISLPQYTAWLETLLNERVNGIENSRLPVPITTLRVLTQLISSTRDEILLLADLLNQVSPENQDAIRRLSFMPVNVAALIGRFARQLLQASSESGKRRARNQVLKNLKAGGEELQSSSVDMLLPPIVKKWITTLRDYFINQHDAGAAFLVLDAWIHWIEATAFRDDPGAAGSTSQSVLGLPIFTPMKHSKYDQFQQLHEVGNEWRRLITDRYAPESWRARLPERAILAYPVPELGRQMSSLSAPIDANDANTASIEAELLRQIMTHRNFYSRSEQTTMVFCGRLFELVVSSLVRDLTQDELASVLGRHPFHSLTALASTKALDLAMDEEQFEDQTAPDDESRDRFSGDLLASEVVLDLIRHINEWRRRYLSTVAHPWLIYNVMNKFFNQVNMFNSRDQAKNVRGSMKEMADTASRSFNALLATFGSFEKGPLFGLDTRIAYQNVGSPETFKSSTLYNLNVRPFAVLPDFSHSFTRALVYHPLRRLIERVFENQLKSAQTEKQYDPSISTDIQIDSASVLLARQLMGGYTKAEILAMSPSAAKSLVIKIQRSFINAGLEQDWRIIQQGGKNESGYGSSLTKIMRVIDRSNQSSRVSAMRDTYKNA